MNTTRRKPGTPRLVYQPGHRPRPRLHAAESTLYNIIFMYNDDCEQGRPAWPAFIWATNAAAAAVYTAHPFINPHRRSPLRPPAGHLGQQSCRHSRTSGQAWGKVRYSRPVKFVLAAPRIHLFPRQLTRLGQQDYRRPPFYNEYSVLHGWCVFCRLMAHEMQARCICDGHFESASHPAYG